MKDMHIYINRLRLCRRPPSDGLLACWPAGLLACWPAGFAGLLACWLADDWLADCWPLKFDMPKTVILVAWRVHSSAFWHPGAPFC